MQSGSSAAGEWFYPHFDIQESELALEYLSQRGLHAGFAARVAKGAQPALMRRKTGSHCGFERRETVAHRSAISADAATPS